VRESACVAVPDQATGEAVALYVVRSDASLTREALLGHLRANLARYKVPHRVEFREELPKTPVGKVLRRALREEVAG
jgi:long-chain acyl-CoA synthetase